MNLLGEGFPKEINEQVDQRQKIYGSGYVDGGTRTPEEITYLNANTSWIKLVSSTDIIDQDVINNAGLRDVDLISGPSSIPLAERFVLFNGTSDNENNLFYGLADSNSILGPTAYGIGGTEFGLRPMMGIKSANIKHENRGSLRRASVQIKAFNKSQFDIIDVLYLRLGFNVLLEWGHSMYYTNDGVLQTSLDNSLASDFLKGGDSYGEFLKKINEKRKSSQGNYDAMFAKVSNIHWSFNVDGSYDITLDLVSIGDVIESFKTNIRSANMGRVGTPPVFSGATLTTEELIEIASYRSNIGQYFKTMDRLLPYGSNDIVKDFDFSNPTVNTTGIVDGIRKSAPKSSNYYQYYCRLGNFLEFLEKYVMYQVTTGAKTLPLMKFDYDVESNLMYLNPSQISVDPRVCVVNKVLVDNKFTYKFLPEGEPFIFSGITTPSKSEYGQIMNIYVNFRFIIGKLDQLVDVEANSVVLIDFLKSIISGINGALGGMNNLEVFVDEVTNTIKIIDKNPFPDSEKVIEHFARSGSIQSSSYDIDDKYAKFYLYGYDPNNNQSGFIRDFKFKTELSPAMSTMITVAAAANSSVVGENSTALSRLNNGLKDRYKDLISNTNDGTTGKVNLVTKYKDIYTQMEDQFFGLYLPYIYFISKLSNFTYSDDEIDTYKDAITTLIKYEQLYHDAYVDYELVKLGLPPKPRTRLQPGTGFIPFNLSLTMDGLSGMKINSKFLIDASYLPSNYPETVEFLIKNLEHKIENNKWSTTLDSYCISKGEYDELQPPKPTSPPPGPAPSGPSAAGCPTDSAAPYVKSTPSSICVSKKILHQWTGTSKKTQLYLHHTAGWPYNDKGAQTIGVWNTRVRKRQVAVGSAYVMDRDGHIETLGDDKLKFLTQGCDLPGPNADTNIIGLGIEIVNPGPAYYKDANTWNMCDGGVLTRANATSRGFTQFPTLANGLIVPIVDWQGNPIKIGTVEYAVEYSDAQISSLRKWIKDMQTKHSIPWQGWSKQTYKEMWPTNASNTGFDRKNTQAAPSGKPGIYTHTAVSTDKFDSMPTPKLINMLKTL